MDKNYAREKLTLLLRDLDSYTGDEFWRQMSRIASGATGEDHAEELVKKIIEIKEAFYSGQCPEDGWYAARELIGEDDD